MNLNFKLIKLFLNSIQKLMTTKLEIFTLVLPVMVAKSRLLDFVINVYNALTMIYVDVVKQSGFIQAIT